CDHRARATGRHGGGEFLRRLRRGTLTAQQKIASYYFHGIHFHTLRRFAAFAGRQIELVSVQRANHLTGADDAFAQRTLPMRATILHGEQLAISLPEDGDLFAFHDEASSLTERDFFDAAEIDWISHCSLPPPT